MSSFEHIDTNSLSAMPDGLRTHYATSNVEMRSRQPGYVGHRIHTQRSQATIMRGARMALRRAPKGTPKTALILGAGNCLDIPLRYLAATFDHTRLVDIDTAATETAIQALPNRLLGKVSLLGADVTGVMAAFGSELDRLSQQHPDSETLYAAIGALLGASTQTTNQPDMGKDYSFVGSHLLMSQLTTLPLSFLHDRLQEHDPDLAEILATVSGSFGGRVETFLNNTQSSHIAQLAGLVASNGVVHFADTLDSSMPGQPGRQMINREVVGPALMRHFYPLHTETWDWRLAQGSFHVVAHTLEPKPN